MPDRDDFLDEIIEERSERNPAFGELVDAALRRRELLHALAEKRERLGLSQTTVAARMGTSQSAVARLEAGEIDAKLSTVERFAAALGRASSGGSWRPRASPLLERRRAGWYHCARGAERCRKRPGARAERFH